jgi:hypothetical protein
MLLVELNLLEAQQLDLQHQLDVASYPQVNTERILSLSDITASIQAALDLADEPQRGIILRGFVARVDAVRMHKVITGTITVRLPNMGEVEVIL